MMVGLFETSWRISETMFTLITNECRVRMRLKVLKRGSDWKRLKSNAPKSPGSSNGRDGGDIRRRERHSLRPLWMLFATAEQELSSSSSSSKTRLYIWMASRRIVYSRYSGLKAYSWRSRSRKRAAFLMKRRHPIQSGFSLALSVFGRPNAAGSSSSSSSSILFFSLFFFLPLFRFSLKLIPAEHDCRL